MSAFDPRRTARNRIRRLEIEVHCLAEVVKASSTVAIIALLAALFATIAVLSS